MHAQPRVLSLSNAQRIGLQNRVIRELREMGCRVMRAHLDPHLTLDVAPQSTVTLRRQPGGTLTQRIDEHRELVSVSLHGCTVRWIEEAA